MAKKVRAAVPATATDKFFYGYMTEPDAGMTTLGVINLEASNALKDVAFHPKNVRIWSAYKPGTIARGGLCAYDKLDDLDNAGYQVSRRKASLPKAGLKSVIVGVRLTPNVVLTWRYRKSKWDALPADVKTAAGVKLASEFPVDECAYHADGFIFKSPIADLDIPAGVYISKTVLRQSIPSSTGKSYSIYKGSNGTPPGTP